NQEGVAPHEDISVVNGDAISRAELMELRQAAGLVGANVLQGVNVSVAPATDGELSETALQKGHRRIEKFLNSSERAEDKNTGELFQYLPPQSHINIKGREFFLSAVVRSGNRPHCVGYTELEDGTFAPRLFYK